MITKFDTSLISTPAGQTGSGGGAMKTILTIVVIAGIAYLTYQYVIKPRMQAAKNQEEND